MISFEKMTLDHVDRVVQIEKESFSNPLSKKLLIREICENEIASYQVILLEGEVVGYFGIWLINDEGHILNIAVAKDHRNKGYGRLLVSRLLELAKEMGIDKLTLEVRESNEPAKKLYTKAGFQVLGIRKNYYTNPTEDAHIMWLDLKEKKWD